MARRGEETPGDDDRHLSRAPAYWDDEGDADVLSTSVWESRRPTAPKPRAPAPRSAEPEMEPESAPPEPEGAAPPSTGAEVSAGWTAALARASGRVRGRQTRLLWTALFVAGALLGGAAVHSWDTQRADAARRDTVQLAARVAEDAASSASWTGTRQPWTLRVVVTNIGPSDVRIQDAKLNDDRYLSHLRTVSRGARLPIGQDTWISMDVTHSCANGGPSSAPREVVLTVRPTGRPERTVRVRLSDDSALLVDTARQKCQSPASDLWITAELAGTPSELNTELATPLRIRQLGRHANAVREIRTPTPGLSVVARPLPLGFIHDVTPPTTLRWSIADCAKARSIVYAEVAVAGLVQLADGGESIRVPIVLDANAVLAIVRFITRACG